MGFFQFLLKDRTDGRTTKQEITIKMLCKRKNLYTIGVGDIIKKKNCQLLNKKRIKIKKI